MKAFNKLKILLLTLSFFAPEVAATVPAWIPGLKQVAVALGWIMMIIMGIRWMIADSPNERADAKKGMMYIMIGLLVIAAACGLMRLYCDTAQNSVGSMDCTSAGPLGDIGC